MRNLGWGSHRTLPLEETPPSMSFYSCKAQGNQIKHILFHGALYTQIYIVFTIIYTFSSIFFKELFTGLGTESAFSTAYHLQTYGKTKRMNGILEDMLRMYAMHQPKKWVEYLPLVEFSYNKRYEESINMSPFEELYGKTIHLRHYLE